MCKKSGKYFKTADIILLAVLLFIAVQLGFFMYENDEGQYAEVYSNGELIQEISLLENGSYTIETQYGTNIIKVQDGEIWCSESDCQNQDCVNFGKISKKGQVILCLPHRLSVEIAGEDVVDGVSY